MRRFRLDGTIRQAYNAVLRPSQFVETNVSRNVGSPVGGSSAVGRLLFVFLVNLFLYAVPITLAGFGSTLPLGEPPSMLTGLAVASGLSPSELWDFVQRFVRNSLYISLGAVLAFVTFHSSVWLTRSSTGILPSLHTVIYSTSAYLAGMFSIVWYIATAPAVVVVDTFILAIQKRFIYAIIDATGTGFDLPSGRPTAVDLAGATPTGRLALATLVVAGGYFMYSMYLGSRINHGASRTTATMTVVTVGIAPVFFVLGSIAITLAGVTIL